MTPSIKIKIEKNKNLFVSQYHVSTTKGKYMLFTNLTYNIINNLKHDATEDKKDFNTFSFRNIQKLTCKGEKIQLYMIIIRHYGIIL